MRQAVRKSSGTAKLFYFLFMVLIISSGAMARTSTGAGSATSGAKGNVVSGIIGGAVASAGRISANNAASTDSVRSSEIDLTYETSHKHTRRDTQLAPMLPASSVRSNSARSNSDDFKLFQPSMKDLHSFRLFFSSNPRQNIHFETSKLCLVEIQDQQGRKQYVNCWK